MKIKAYKENYENDIFSIYFFVTTEEDIEIKIETKIPHELHKTNEGQYYGMKNEKYLSNFYRLDLKIVNGYLEFLVKDYDDVYTKIPISTTRQSMYSLNNMIFRIRSTNYLTSTARNRIIFFRTNTKFQFEQIVEDMKILNDREIYLFFDRRMKADDNAESLYEYYMNHRSEEFNSKQMYFVIEKDCPDYTRLIEKGFKVVAFGSQIHKFLYMNARCILTSNAGALSINPFNSYFISNTRAKIVALSHGVISNDLSKTINVAIRKHDLCCTVGPFDNKLYKQFSGFDNIQITGLARHDNFAKFENTNTILYFPTWNKVYAGDLENSDYYHEITKLITSQTFDNILADNNMKMKVVFHPLASKNLIEIGNLINDNITNIELLSVEEISLNRLLGENKLLITDTSSIRFDNLYQRKNTILYTPYEKNYGDSEYDESKMFLRADTLEQLILLVKDLIDKDFALDNEYIEQANDFFAVESGENCKKICEQVDALLK